MEDGQYAIIPPLKMARKSTSSHVKVPEFFSFVTSKK